MAKKQISQKIKELRMERGLTLEQVADFVGVGKSTVRKWETGMIENMRRNKIAALAKVLQIPTSYFIYYDYDYDIDPEHRLSSIPEHIRRELQEKYPGDPHRQWCVYWDQSALAFEKHLQHKHDFPEMFADLPENIIPMPQTRPVPLLGTIACGEPILAEENIEAYVSVNKDIPADFALKCKGDSMINARIFDGDIVYIRRQANVDDGEIAAVLIDTEATLKRVRRYPGKLVLSPCNPMYDDLIYTAEQLDSVRILGKAVAFTSTL